MLQQQHFEYFYGLLYFLHSNMHSSHYKHFGQTIISATVNEVCF